MRMRIVFLCHSFRNLNLPLSARFIASTRDVDAPDEPLVPVRYELKGNFKQLMQNSNFFAMKISFTDASGKREKFFPFGWPWPCLAVKILFSRVRQVLKNLIMIKFATQMT
jgi:hypothetical protein